MTNTNYNKQDYYFAIYFLLVGTIYACFIVVDFEMHLSSILAQSFCFIIFLLYSSTLTQEVSEDNSDKMSGFQKASKTTLSPFALYERSLSANHLVTKAALIVTTNALIGILGLLVLQNKIDYSNSVDSGFDIKGFVTYTGIMAILVAQIGGFFLQSILTFMVAFFFDCQKPYSSYFSIIGLAYIGFFIVSILTAFFNNFFMPSNLAYSELAEFVQASTIHKILGKIGEYFTIILIAFGIFKIEKRSPISCLFIASLPNFLLLSINLLYKLLLT
jgi:hypothetical protein